jgi:hypothetical protein
MLLEISTGQWSHQPHPDINLTTLEYVPGDSDPVKAELDKLYVQVAR